MKKKVGLFGGSFDPIHLGHLTLALSLLEAFQLEEVLFCPAFLSPFKQNKPSLVSPKERLEMVRLATASFPKASLCEEEIKKEGMSFTIDTVRALYKKRQGIQLHLLLAGELVADFPKWKEADELAKLAPPLIGTPLKKLEKCPFFQVHIPHMEISSTQIRERLKQGLYCGHLLPESVAAYIQKKGLYR